MDIKITKRNGDIFTLGSLGVTVEDVAITSAPLRAKYSDTDDIDGVIAEFATWGQRLIAVPFHFAASDHREYLRKRDLLYTLFSDKKPFYIEELRSESGGQYAFRDTIAAPASLPYIPNRNMTAKRYMVRQQGAIEIEQGYRSGSGELLLETTGSPLAESANEVERTYTAGPVLFDNQGTETIDMRAQDDTEIEFRGASSGLTITNETTGDVWSYSGSTAAGDIILLKGVQSLKNDASIFRDTNKKLLTFAPGVNRLTISGATDFTLSVRTRFYFM